jgi:hypothetical protein
MIVEPPEAKVCGLYITDILPMPKFLPEMQLTLGEAFGGFKQGIFNWAYSIALN